MFLGLVAQRKLTETFEVWDPIAEVFGPTTFKGRIEIADRFLSNFNKPLRRRMLFTAPGEQLPESVTFRHPGTGDVYLLGQDRQDATIGNGTPHIRLSVCHLVTEELNGSAGLATLYRKAPAGPAEDPGWLVESIVARGFADIEFRTSASQPETEEIRVQNFIGFLPRTVTCEPWDYLELQGKRYRVVDSFADSGFSAFRVDFEPDRRIDFVVHRIGPRTYDRVTHEYTSVRSSHNVSGMMVRENSFPEWTNDAEGYIDVVINTDHIGFAPEPDTTEVEYRGRRRVVRNVSLQTGDLQYRLRCE